MKIKRNKKKAFTILELVVVIAIIGILAGVLVPKVSKYIMEAKKVKVVSQARNVIMVVETYNAKNNSLIPNTKKVKEIASSVYVPSDELEEFQNNVAMILEATVGECRSIANGDKEVKIGEDGTIVLN